MKKYFNQVSWLVVCLALPAWSTISPQAEAAEGHRWAQWGGPNGNHISEETGWQTKFPDSGPRVLWEAPHLGLGYSSVVVDRGSLYTMGWRDGKDIVYCLNADNGDELWRYPYESELLAKYHGGGTESTPAVDGDRLYTLGCFGQLFCFDAKTSDVHWSKQVEEAFGAKIPTWGFSGSPIVVGDVVFLDLGVIVALNKFTGETIWKTGDYGAAYSTPLPFTHRGRQLLATFPAYGLVVIDPTSGDEVAKFRWRTKYEVNAATPVIHDDRIFISSGYGTGCALLRLDEDLNLEWKNKYMRNHMDTCVLIDGHLYGFDDAKLRCLDFNDGESMWTEGLGKGALSAAAGKLIILSGGGDLIIANASPQGFDKIDQAKVLKSGQFWTAPVLVNGKIYCRSSDGQLVCVDVSK